MAEVVTLSGEPLKGEPNAEVVERLEDLLAQAKAGQVQAFAFALLEGQGQALRTGWNGVAGTKWPMSAGILLLQHRYGRMLMDEG